MESPPQPGPQPPETTPPIRGCNRWKIRTLGGVVGGVIGGAAAIVVEILNVETGASARYLFTGAGVDLSIFPLNVLGPSDWADFTTRKCLGVGDFDGVTVVAAFSAQAILGYGFIVGGFAGSEAAGESVVDHGWVSGFPPDISWNAMLGWLTQITE